MKLLIRLSLVCFLLQWFHFNGFLSPIFIKRDVLNKFQLERSSRLSRRKVSFLPSFQLRLAKKSDPLDDFLGAEDEEFETPRASLKPSKPQSSSLKHVESIDNDFEGYEDEIFRKWLSEAPTDDGLDLPDDDDRETQSIIPYNSGDDDDEDGENKDKKKEPAVKHDDGVVRDNNGKVIGLSLRVNSLLNKLPIDPKYRTEIEKNLLHHPEYRGRFLTVGEKYLEWEAKQFQQYLNELYSDQTKFQLHLQQLQNDSDYAKEFQFQYNNLDEYSIKQYQKEQELQDELLPIYDIITEIRLNETFANEFNKQLRENKNHIQEQYSDVIKSFSEFIIRRQNYIQQFEELGNAIDKASETASNNEQSQRFLNLIELRLQNDPIYAEQFQDGFKQLLKYKELEEAAEEVDIDSYTSRERVIVVPEGFLIQRYGVKSDEDGNDVEDDDDEDDGSTKPIILQLPETTKFATYSKLPDDGRFLFTLQPFEDPADKKRTDMSELMVVFHKSIELQQIEPEITLEEDDQWEHDFEPLGIIKVPNDVDVIEVPAERMIGEISSVLTPKGMKVVRPRPDSLETPPGEVILVLPKEIEVEQKVGVYPKSQLIIEAHKDKKHPVYYLSQNVTIRRLLPEDAERYPEGMIIVPPLTAVSTKAHELIDYEFKERYLSKLPDELRKEIGSAWEFEPRDKEEMKRIEKLKANRRSSSELEIDDDLTSSSSSFQPDPQSADTWGDDIDWPRSIKSLKSLKNIPENYPAYCLMYFIRPDEINDLLQLDYDRHEQYGRSFKRLIYHDIVRTDEFVNSQFKIPEFEGVFHFFVGKENEWEETIDEVETFMSSCPLKTSGKVEYSKVIAIHEIDGERGRTPARFKDWRPEEEVEITEDEALQQLLRQYDADLPAEYVDN